MKRRLVPRRQTIARNELSVTISHKDMIRFSVTLILECEPMLDLGNFVDISVDNEKKRLYIKEGDDFPVRKASSSRIGVCCYDILQEMEVELDEDEKSRRFKAKFNRGSIVVYYG